MSIDVDHVAGQVLENCAISDAQHAGAFSICGLALRLRNLFKWERGLDPWVERGREEVLDWIGHQEERWEEVAEREFTGITLSGRTLDPFDVEGINALLEPLGFLYGAGYARELKPVFFVAAIEERRRLNGHRVYILGRELARDLLTIPAFTQEGVIVVRKDAARSYLWDGILYLGKSGRPALRFALEQYGLTAGDPAEIHGHLDRILADEVDIYIHHELGEAREDGMDRQTWKELVAAFPQSPTELLARAVKDLLADTNSCGTLAYIVEERRRASLGFFTAFLDGLRRELFPEMRQAFSAFSKEGDWGAIERARQDGFQSALRYADILASAFQKGRDQGELDRAEAEIEQRLLKPLGISRDQLAGEESEV